MRIIAGQWRGRPLVAPRSSETRPTADRAREGLFSMLTSRLGAFDGLAVLDLFAGTGALGLEALSRGAGTCLFVEQDRAALAALRTNIERLGATGTEVKAQSVTTLGPAGRAHDLVLLDPPYAMRAGVPVLERLARLGWLAPGALASVESGPGETVRPGGFVVEAERRYGAAQLTLLRYQPPA
ncbi:16S rRNA (guanine(966)-N(2))-methyltransferase RsmD [Sphingomonas morindae]|uniref:16S rRNA (Guanine(966)-N(2))-methyltransferase RsmD n=1 Tax=Sphingomonas morindae TaxID=1541170 RepID=A0ABY4X5L3_9SPHN|nr:16S rRNA (guanine(966)-N(2))-methyltransferase RsmD [Sphingomonas morindae]USI72177.1 16S rRNA (guanine(966)-N(2))-methyltransferase RsmD [Sphingomonas morindae]